jgi:hypothetical protein
MAPNLLSELSDQAKNPTTDDYLPRIPFHEVNVTKLANWSITALDGTATTAATVCDEPISNSDYCRGIVTRLAAGDVRVWGRIEPSNSGITDTAAIDTHDQVFSPDNPADPSVSIFDITDGATSTDSFVISGSITIAANAGTLNYSDITVIGKGFDPATDLDKSDSINCTTQNAGDGTYTFECAIEKDFDSDGDGVFDQASGNFVIDIGGYNYVYEDNQGNRETKNNEVDGTVSAGANLDGTCVTDDGQEADTTQFGFTDLSSDTTLDLAITKDNNTSTGGTCLIP